MRVLGLDIGEKRTGIAVSDPEGRVATPLKVVDASDRAAVHAAVAEWEAGLVIVGLPLSLDGSEGPQAARVRACASRMETDLDVPVRLFDERLTSVQAERAMGEAGLTGRERRGRVDMVAAALMLQAYLDSEAADER